MFDLDKAIARWLRGLSQRGGFGPEDLEELEGHLRDFVDAETEAGRPQRDAFLAGIRRFGDPESVAAEYRKMSWTKERARSGLKAALAAEASMSANYAKVGLRNLLRQKAYSAINIFGLALGLACCLLIALYVRFESSYDRHHEHADRIHRVTREWRDDNGERVLALARISMPIGPALERELPEVERAVRMVQADGLVSSGDARFAEEQIFIVDSSIFDVFSFQFLAGNAQTALAAPNTVVLTEQSTHRYFGSDSPIGRTLRLFDEVDLEVTGVVASQPAASHFHPDLLVSLGTLDRWTNTADRKDWGQYNNYGTYILLAAGTDPDVVKAKLPSFLRSHYAPDNNTQDALVLQPLTDIHLLSNLDAEFEANGNETYVSLFSAVAILVLLIACFNFINLATARASRRSREVGMRKALGADRQQLVRQFLGESAILTVLSLVVAAFLTWLALPVLAQLTGRPVGLGGLGIWSSIFALVALLVVVSVLAGGYPAVYLARFRPIDVLRKATPGSWRSSLRSVLVVSQFAISIVLIVGVGIILRQVSFVQSKDLGFGKEHLVVLPITSDMSRDFERYRLQLEISPAVERVTASRLIPSRPLVDHIGVQAEVDGELRQASLALNPVDHDFLETYGMHLVAGRSFSKDLASDSTEAFVINEAAVRLLGWHSAEDAVGRLFSLEGRKLSRTGSVIGVVKDFHFESLRNEIAPLVLFIMPERFARVTARLTPGRIDEALAFLESKWAEYRPNRPFTYSFIDQDFGALYESEKQVGRLFGYFSTLALTIALLGLLGLASFMTERRRKEIGIRKVLGATVPGIMRMLSMDFLRLVAAGFVIACPIAFVTTNWWLDRFAYHVDPGLWLYALSGVTVALIALATVSFQSVRTATADPVLTLRVE